MQSETVLIKYGDPIKAVKKANEMSIEELTITLQGQAQSYAPVGDTGNLKGSIKRKVTKNRGQVEGEVRAGGEGAPYAPYLEFGTFKMAARPYMRPAGEVVLKGDNVEKVNKKYSRAEMDKELKKRKEEHYAG